MYDPFYWYERDLDNDYFAQQLGYENYEDYLENNERMELCTDLKEQ